MEQTLGEKQKGEHEALAELDWAEAERDAVNNDPQYLEVPARKRLNLYREGEQIWRIQRPEGPR